MTEEYPLRPGSYYQNGKWYPSKATKKKRQQEKLFEQIRAEIKLFPKKYPYETFVTSKKEAEILGYEVWWGKCKKRHLTERHVSERGCPICLSVTRTLRDKRLKDGLVKLNKFEQKELSEIYSNARKLTKETGIPHHVDHVRPLAAGGTHHPLNLQILTGEENMSKGATYEGKKATYSENQKRIVRKKFKDELQDEKNKALAKKQATQKAKNRKEEKLSAERKQEFEKEELKREEKKKMERLFALSVGGILLLTFFIL